MKCECGEIFDDNKKECPKCEKSFNSNSNETNNNTEKLEEVASEIISNESEIIEIEETQKESDVKAEDSKKGLKVQKHAIKIFGGVLIIGLLALLINIGLGSNRVIDYKDYPYCIISSSEFDVAEGSVLEFYQDGVFIKDKKHMKNKVFSIAFDPNKKKGDKTNIEVKVGDEVIYKDSFTIKSTIFDKIFTDSTVYKDEYPNLAIKVKMNQVLVEKNGIESLDIRIDGINYPYNKCVANGDGTSTVYFDIDGARRKSDFEFEYVYTILGREEKVSGVLELPPYENVKIEKVKSDYSEYPLVRHYFNVYDSNTNNIINGALTPDDFALYEMNGNDKVKVENTNIVSVIQNGKASVELVADVSTSIDDKGLYDSKKSLNTFLDIVNFGSYDEVELLSFSDYFIENQRYTNNKAKLVRAVNELEMIGGTAFYDALGHALERTVIQRGSKMIIATTDGNDNMSSEYNYKLVVDKAKEFQIPIYIVGVGDQVDTENLTLLANATGGEYISVNEFDQLSDKFEGIYIKGKDGFVVEYDVNDVSKEDADVIITLAGNVYGGEEVVKYEPIFVSWGGTKRIDDETTPYDETSFDKNYYDGTHRYEVIFEDVSWQMANKKAVDKGGYLARITSEEEFDVIVGEIQKATTSKAYLYWLGGSRKNNVDGNYTWVDADLNVMSETLPENIWLQGEPSYREYDANGKVLFEEEYLNMFYVEKIDKWVMNDVTDDVLSRYDGYKGKVAYVIEYEK